jgi:glycosyltransferase involved in cell wall biosynthesis
MYADHSVAVVVPCYNERDKIGPTLAEMPEMIDRIYVVDDASTDDSAANVAARGEHDPRIVLIRHAINRGVGAAIGTGYIRAADDGYDLVAVMAGDGQMDPQDLAALMEPAVVGDADYVKGNRFFHDEGVEKIPRTRLFGNLVLSALTKVVSGYWHVSDTQCGYTVINREALKAIDWRKVWPRYGCPNDFLTRLNIANMRVAEVRVRARYGDDWSSKMRVGRVIWPMLTLLWRLFRMRLYRKYVYLNGHPIVAFYLFSLLTFLLAALLFVYILLKFILTGIVPQAALIMFGIALGLAVQLLFGAFTLDYQENSHLYIFPTARGEGRKPGRTPLHRVPSELRARNGRPDTVSGQE